MKTNRHRLLYFGGMTFRTRAEIGSNSFKSTRLYHLQTGVSVGDLTSFGGLVVYPSNLSNALSLVMECFREKCRGITRTALCLKSYLFADSENSGQIQKFTFNILTS